MAPSARSIESAVFKKFDPGGWQLGFGVGASMPERFPGGGRAVGGIGRPNWSSFHTPYPIDEEFLLHLIERGLPR